jgi:hypothetical protein
MLVAVEQRTAVSVEPGATGNEGEQGSPLLLTGPSRGPAEFDALMLDRSRQLSAVS